MRGRRGRYILLAVLVALVIVVAVLMRAEQTVSSDIVIEAPAREVWTVLSDFPAYRQWNPFIREIRGPLLPGGRLTVVTQPPGKRERVSHPVVTEVVMERRLSWRNRVMLPRIYDSDHRFMLEPLGPQRTRFFQRETFRGLMVRPLEVYLRSTISEGFTQMNLALKWRVEGRPLVLDSQIAPERKSPRGYNQ